MRRVLKKLIWVVVLLVLVAVLVFAFLPTPVEVDLAEVSRGPVEVTVNEEGRTRVRDRYVISAPTAGNLLRIHLRAGDAVTAGETVLARIEPARPQQLDVRQLAEAEARVDMAQAAVERAAIVRERTAAELAWAEAERERIQRLYEQGAAGRRELDDVLLLHRVRTHEHEAAYWSAQVSRYELQMAQAVLIDLRQASDTRADNQGEIDRLLTLRAPVDGQVLRVMQESESPVQPGTALLEIGQVSELEVVMDVLSREAVRIRPGDPVRFTRWGGEDGIRGTVRRVEPSAFTRISALGVEEQRVNVIADLAEPWTTDGRTFVGDGFRVDGQVIVDQRTDVLRAPVGALFRHGEEWAVFAVEDDTARLRVVRLGLRGEMQAEILEGLAEGERVIIYPSDQIRDGVSIQRR